MLKLTPELIDTLDKLAPSPSELASKVYNLLKSHHSELTDYELLAFCVEFIGMQSIAGYEYLSPTAMPLIKDFYYAHYLRLFENKELCPPISVADLMREDGSKLGPSMDSSDSSQPK